MGSLRIGFIGLGGICRQRHAPGLRQIPGVEMLAVSNRTRESSERAAQDFCIPNICDSWVQLVARPDIDAVVIGTWPYMHYPMTLAVLDAGKHVFCQARMAMNALEAQVMYDKARDTNLIAMLCPVQIGLRIDAAVKRLLSEGAVGDVRLIRVQSFSSAYADAETPMNWRKDHRLSGLNALTLGMYIEVIHRWFGWTRAVCTSTQIFAPERIDATGERVHVLIPDQFLIHTELQCGVPVQYTITGCVRGGADAIEIYGDAGAMRYEVERETLQRWVEGKGFVDIELPEEELYDVAHWRVERDFVDAIREGKEYHPNFEDGYRYMQVIQAVYDSADSQGWIMLDA